MKSAIELRCWIVSLAIASLSSAQVQPAATLPATTQASTEPATQPSSQPATLPVVPEEMVAISFRDVGVDQIFAFISEKTGKPVIPADSIKQKRITIVSTQQKPLSEAMQIITEALRQSGIVMEESPRVINMKSISEAKQSLLDVIPPEKSVSTIKNKSQVVHKVFELKYFETAKMKDVILPMLPDFAQVTADANTRRLIITDTVEDLERIEQLINSLDVPQADQTIKKIIVVKQGDASDIVATVRVLIASSLGAQAREVITANGGGGSAPGRGGNGRPPQQGPMVMGPDGSMIMMGGQPGGDSNAPPSGGAGSAVFVEENKAPVVLLADVPRNWIIAVASTRVMALIEEWVTKLDVPSAGGAEQFDVLSIEHADMDEVARQIQETIGALPTGDARQSVRLVPFSQSRKILVTGSKRGREMVKDLLAQLDRESGNQTMRVFQLKYADAEDVAGNIQELYGAKKDTSYNPYFDEYPRRDTAKKTDRLKVTADKRRNAVIVFSDTALLDQIDKLLHDDWDLPISETDAQPKIYTLKHIDPVKLKDLLEELFAKGKSKKSTSDSPFFYDMMMDLANSKDDQPVGRLFGQFRFQAMADSNRLLVVAKNAANYAVMDNLISQLDQPQDAGLPQMIELKHANAEDLAEQLNATLAEPGTLAEIVRAKREFSTPTRQGGVSSPQQNNTSGAVGNNQQQQQQQQDGANPNSMTFWWQRSPRRVDEQPTSNLIGKIRFVPIHRRNALLVVAPSAYAEPIKQLVEQLDQPGMQVMIHAIIAEVQSEDSSSLGIRLASDPSVLKDSRLTDSSIGGSANFNTQQITAGTPGTGSSSGVFTGGLNVNILLELLIRNYGLKILFEPKLYTADNQEAEFFDGQDVPYQTQAQTSPEGTAVVQSFTYTAVGTFLRIRPHITNERDVDLTVNLQLSSIVDGQTSFGNFIFDRRETTTHVILRDGETVMLSGIIRQESSKDIRKWPILGDIPLIGGLFRSTETIKQNRELVAFITPHVIRRETESATAESYKEWIEKLRNDLGGKPPTTAPVAPVPTQP